MTIKKSQSDIKHTRFWGAMFAAATLAMSASAQAALGTFPLSGANKHVMGTRTINPTFSAFAQAPGAVVAASAFTINSVTLDTGTTVKEYVATATNQVFAVAWNGPALPNLREILGVSFDAYVAAPTGPNGQHLGGPSSRSYSANGLVVHSHGVPGHFAGYAYLSASFPPGVTLQTLRQAQ
jgi:hypothetical protein